MFPNGIAIEHFYFRRIYLLNKSRMCNIDCGIEIKQKRVIEDLIKKKNFILEFVLLTLIKHGHNITRLHNNTCT